MTPPILIVIPLTPADLPLATSLLSHLATHGPIHHHSVLFVADRVLTKAQVAPLEELGRKVFPAGGEGIHTAIDLSPPYPQGHNLRFETAAKHIAATRRLPWLWLDPRCVAVRAGWLNDLEAEYNARRRPILGQVLTPAANGTAQPLVSSTAIYPIELPKRVLQRLVARRDVDFEKSCADLLVPLAHPSSLIWVHALNGNHDLPKPPSSAVLVHTARAREYAALLRGEPIAPRGTPPTVPPEPDPPLAVVVPSRVKEVSSAPSAIAGSSRAAFYHSGDLGDIIYALAAIRLAGGGHLILGPRSLNTHPPTNPMKEEQFERIAPLLRAQPYLTKVSFSDRHPGTAMAFDLNRFRNLWSDKNLCTRLGIKTLVRMHCHTLGVDEKHHPLQTWLAVPSPISIPYFVMHRSARYNAEGNDAFPWPLILRRYAGRLLFIGLPTEHADFERAFSVRLPFWRCVDFLELARLIAGSLGFIGNQSFPNAIALGYGQRVLQESWPVSPDCVLPRGNFLTQPINETLLRIWEKASCPSSPPKPRVDEPTPTPVETSAVTVTKDKPLSVLFQCPVDGFSGIGQSSVALALGLAARGHQICVKPTRETKDFGLPDRRIGDLCGAPLQGSIRVCMETTGPYLRASQGGDIAITLWETDVWPKPDIEALNRFQRVLVTCQWNAQTLPTSGCTVPVGVIPLGIDGTLFKPAQRPNLCAFGAAARVAGAGGRKGIDLVVQAFQQAFPEINDVQLRIKVFSDCPVADFGRDSRIEVNRAYMTRAEIAKWHQHNSIFVSASFGEGFGLCLLEAMACGAMPIACAYGGHAEFFNASVGYCLRYELEPAAGGTSFEGMGHWAVPSLDDLVAKMRRAYRTPKKVIQFSKLAAFQAARFSWDHAVECLEKELYEYRGAH